MGHALKQLFSDFLSTIVFLAVYAASGDVLVATGVAIASAIAQFVVARLRNHKLDIMTLASVALVIVLGAATLLTRDPRFVLIKPSIGHFAIGAIMLKRGWMLRYMPQRVTDTIPHYVTVAGYLWAALMFLLGAGTIAIAMTGDIKLWALYVSVIAVGAKIAAFLVQYTVFRVTMRRKLRAQAAAA
jgi:intracellular septation protein A